MKTKLFSLFVAVLLFSHSGKAQANAKTAAFPVITLIGSGNGGWTDTAETELLTSDGITYSLVDKVLTDGELKFREGKCWTTGCAGTVGNVYGWGPTDSQFAVDKGWPSGTNAAPVDGGKNIFSKAGVWTITFNRVQGSWSFVPGTPLPVIKIVGTAVTASGGATMTTANGTVFTANKVTLVPGNCQFSIDGTRYGSTSFPNGSATSTTGMIPVTTTGIDYDVTFDYTTAAYTFKVATFPKIAIIGGGAGGWPAGTPGEIDPNAMTTTDGENYTINHIPFTTDGIKFRQDNSWDKNWGGDTWPSGTSTGGNIPAVAGNYNGTFKRSTGAYSFTLNTVAIVGSGVGGWPTDPQVDANKLSTVNGVNYTLNGLVVTTGEAKFRENNGWAVNSGGDLFPAGTKTGNNIPTTAGTYNLKYNMLTGAYDFGTALAVKNFNAGSFKAYPNPTKNSWNITSGNDDITSVQVFNVLGKAVYTKNSASKEVIVNAAALSKGVYFAKVSTVNGSSTVKLVKE
ncbi:T9SS type A sorting domain-containing protein [Flavobacterium cellulosilyticum]|uniref:T9SS type A sorting domain-containing protein n=1 Tax=Flavobacterium cellulosilyticum TaxID=2541731 RepID=A0A4R5CHM1_9FLAO|nr:T9SS type A sorting domain-containing protein [Flavobacterium cellulosilyticum]TDD99245.1 T9SS type A sorting domain-containing protein [Flavobacterium cellulosilyticum]